MIRLQKIMTAMALCFCFVAINAQTDPHQNSYAGNFTANENIYVPVDTKIATSDTFKQENKFVSEAFLNANDGFIGIVFSKDIAKKSIYYKIVDNNGTEIYNGSAHSNMGSQPTLYYNTQNLPSGKYRVFIENDDFFMSKSFIK